MLVWHQNYMIGFFLGSRTSILWIIGESAGEGLWLLALVKAGRHHVTGVRWHVTCDKWHVTSHVSYAICELWHVTHDFFLLQKVADNLQEVRKIRRKKIKKCLKVQNSFKKRRDFIISLLLSAHAERVGVSRMRNSQLLASLTHYNIREGLKKHVFLSTSCG